MNKTKDNCYKDLCDLADLELAIYRLFQSLIRHSESMISHLELKLTFEEILILQIIAMQAKPTSIPEITNTLHRLDTTNIQYIIKKLSKLNLVEKLEQTPNYKKSTTYQITKMGQTIIQDYSQVQNQFLTAQLSTCDHLSIETIHTMLKNLNAMYEKSEATLLKTAWRKIFSTHRTDTTSIESSS